MKKIWYHAVRAYVKFAYVFFYRKIRVSGKNELPSDLPLMFLPNHQNSFTDAIMLAISNKRVSHFFARADVFKNPFLSRVMQSINLRPIYRIRDGKEALQKNEEVFQVCYNALARRECLMIHPEGTHSLKKRVRHISKGFSRIAFGMMERHPEIKVGLVPVGINYSDPSKFWSDVSVNYGPVLFAEDFNGDATLLREKVEEELKRLTVHIEDPAKHDEIYLKLKNSLQDLSDPEEGNKQIRKIEAGEPITTKKKTFPWWYYPLIPVAIVNSFLPILLWKAIKGKIKDPAFHGAIKFSIGMILGPPIYLLIWYLVWEILGWQLLLVYLPLSLLAIRSLVLLESAKDPVINYNK